MSIALPKALLEPHGPNSPRIGVFIDAENVSPQNVAKALLKIFKEHGSEKVGVLAAYISSGKPPGSWKEIAETFDITWRCFQPPRSTKNFADMNMTVEIMEALFVYPCIDHFIIVSSDSDFIPLIDKLRTYEKTCTVYGKSHSPVPLRESARHFHVIDTIPGTLRLQEGKAPASPAKSDHPSLPPDLSNTEPDQHGQQNSLVGEARESGPSACSRGFSLDEAHLIILSVVDSLSPPQGWAKRSKVAKVLNNQHGLSPSAFGYRDFKAFLKSVPGINCGNGCNRVSLGPGGQRKLMRHQCSLPVNMQPVPAPVAEEVLHVAIQLGSGSGTGSEVCVGRLCQALSKTKIRPKELGFSNYKRLLEALPSISLEDGGRLAKVAV